MLESLKRMFYHTPYFVHFRLGDLLCCETCSAVYHLACVDPPLEEVPDDDWLCSICRAHQVGYTSTV